METDLQVFTHKGCPIRYRFVGREDAPLVVLTHGGMLDHRVWEPQVPALSQHYRLLLWDVRGHGRSRPGGKHRSIPDVTDDLAALLDHFGYMRAVHVGLSAGGLLVQEFAYRYPDRVVGLVVAGQTCWTDLSFKSRLVFSRWSVAGIALVTLLIPWNLYLRMLLRQGAAGSKPQTHAYLEEVFSQWSKMEFVRHVLYSTGGLRRMPDYRILQPLLIVHGEHEMEFVRNDAAAWARREPRSRHVVVLNAGHVVNMDNSEAFNTVLLEFLGELDERGELRQGAGPENAANQENVMQYRSTAGLTLWTVQQAKDFTMSTALRRTGWGVVSLLVVLMAFVAGVALFVDPAEAPDVLGDLYERRIALWTHIVGSTIALVAGPVQFYLRRLTPMPRRTRYLPLHRWLGWVYIAGAVIGAGFAGLYLAFQTHTGFAAGLGFGTLAVLVLITTTFAWLRIRTGDEHAHREWMTRSFALLFAAPTLRLWLVLFTVGFGVPERDAYIAVAWFCWVPNLIVAELLIQRLWRRPALERQAAAAASSE